MSTTTGTVLAVPQAAQLPSLPTAAGAILERLRDELAQHVADVSTHKGREEIRARAAQVRRDKAEIGRLAKRQTEEARSMIGKVNAEMRDLEGRMDMLAEEVRRPLTEHEAAEKRRIDDLEDALSELLRAGRDMPQAADMIRERLAAVESMPERDWQEYQDRASDARVNTLDNLRNALTVATNREAEAKELAELRAMKAEQERKEAEAAARQRATEAAETARQRAAAKAEAEAERTRIAADAAAKEEREKAAAAIQAEQERTRAAEERAAKAAALAIQAERDRVEREAEAARVREAKAAEDKARRRRVMHAAADSIAEVLTTAIRSTDKDAALAIVEKIAAGKVPHTTVNFAPTTR